MKKDNTLTTREEELLNYLWDFNEPMTSNVMAERMKEYGWNNVTLLKTVQSLTASGYLIVAGLEKAAKVYARKLMPAMTREEYYSSIMSKRGIGVNSIAKIADALIDYGPEMSKNEKDELITQLENIISALRDNCNK